jgi:enoyl-[acyl-carrier-protein] reductase (NADH)
MFNYLKIWNPFYDLSLAGRRAPEDIGLIAAFLASDEARWLTGEIIFGSGVFH